MPGIGRTEVDFACEGRQTGFLDLPHSAHDDAWGVLRVPLGVIARGRGPTVILAGGNHGDEYEGPIVLGELLRGLDPGRVHGRLIVLPALNLPAVEAGRRVSPLDGLNLNRSFPGDPLGSPTRQIAAFLAQELFPLADAFLDLHSGGSSLVMLPSAIVEPAADPALAARIRAAAAAFDAPMQVIIPNRGDPRTSTATAVRAGLVALGTELGGGGGVSPAALRIARQGVTNVLAHLGALEAEVQLPAPRPLFSLAGPGAHLLAPEPGVFEPFHDLGAEVAEGQPAGRLHFLPDPRREPVTLHYGAGGVLYGRRQPGPVRAGSCCLVVAQPAEAGA
jgi:predicted deacylase